MTESLRRAYLDALGIDVWIERPAEAARDRLFINRGQGGTLLICDSAEASVSRLAADISRALGGDPVWGWPDPECKDGSMTVEEAVSSRLFTRVIIFGAGISDQLFKGKVPQVLVSSSINVASGLETLAVRGTAKLEFWRQLKGWHEPVAADASK